MKFLSKFIPSFLVMSLFSLGMFGLASPAIASEQIDLFSSEIIINQDTSISVTEIIQYQTTESRHGIFRYIPVRYSRGGLNYTAKINNVSITDGAGLPIPFQTSREQGNVKFKIGDPNSTFTGEQTYIISYRVENALNLIEAEGESQLVPELYWDITGDGWQIEILRSMATVRSPYAKIERQFCYSGPFGSDDGLCTVELVSPNQADFRYSQPINYNDNMTVALALDPNGDLMFPTASQKLVKNLLDNLPLIPLIFPGLILTIWWWLKGRDQEFLSWNVFKHDATEPTQRVPLWSARQAPMVYEPIKELTPGEAGAMLNERVDNQDIIAEIIDLARQKYLKIDRIEAKKLLILPDSDYEFTKLKEAGKNLPEHQKYLHEQIFKSKDKIKLSELKGSFYIHMAQVKQLIFKSVLAKKLFVANPTTARGVGLAAAVALSMAAFGYMFILLEQALWWAIPIELVSFAISMVAAYNLPAKTAVGSNFAWQAKGLQRSIKNGAWREKIKEKHLFFEEVLPFAIALGVVDRLAKDMDELNVKPPTYVAAGGAGWNSHTFVNSFSSAASSSLSYNPNSSSSGSGGSSGGGSSGGGGGGGGGGSW